MDYERLLELVRDRAVLPYRESAELAVAATLETLGERLLPLDASQLASELPAPLSEALRRRSLPGEYPLSELFQRVAERTGVSLPSAREQAISVCLALGDWLDDEVAIHFRERLPSEFAELLRPPPRFQQPIHEHHVLGRDTTLSGGRAGSQHPLSEARPERAHSQSVVRSDDPHADTKLSSARGLTQERVGRTLAQGHSGSDHPLNDSD
ncbi:MAG TPA: DUF2267 domain-containing protein [Myxococcales bacterium]